MKSCWTKGIKDEEAKADIESAFRSSTVVRKRLKKLIEDKASTKERECIDADNYDKANWAYLMADSQGYKRALQEILSLITEK